jgi:hypothetical protein
MTFDRVLRMSYHTFTSDIMENAVKSQAEDKSCEKSQGRSAFTVSSPPHVKYQDVQIEGALGCRFR